MFGTTGKVNLLIIIICKMDMRTVPNIYILNLATSNIIYLTVLLSEACTNRISVTWQRDDFMCKFLPFCRRLSVDLSAYSVDVLSIQRYRITANSFHVPISSQPTWHVPVATICGVWLVAPFFFFPKIFSKYLCHEYIILGCINTIILSLYWNY
jgi:hypothetical protein